MSLFHAHLLSHPVVSRLHETGKSLLVSGYAKCLPILAELSRNSLLAGATGFVLGVLVRHCLGFNGKSRAKCPMKAQMMKGIVCSG